MGEGLEIFGFSHILWLNIYGEAFFTVYLVLMVTLASADCIQKQHEENDRKKVRLGAF